MTNWRERPNVLPWPPLIFASAAIAALALGWIYPFRRLFAAGLVTHAFGTVIMLLGLGLDVYAMVEMRRLRATILPHRAATALATTGPFALARNPIYPGSRLSAWRRSTVRLLIFVCMDTSLVWCFDPKDA